MATGFGSSTVLALDESRLWLPSSSQKYYLDLIESAEAAEALEICTEVLKGTLDLERSEPDKPIFRIQCRRPDGLSYNEMVDGLTKETLTHQKPVIVELTEEELEQQRIEEEKRQAREREARKQQLQSDCNHVFDSETALMLKLERLTAAAVEPRSFDGEKAEFVIDFNAVSIDGKPLQYRATCSVATDSQAELIIKPRR